MLSLINQQNRHIKGHYASLERLIDSPKQHKIPQLKHDYAEEILAEND